jgi:signal peptidase I
MLERRLDSPDLVALVAEVVGRRGRLEVRVHGSSMVPTLADGDHVVLGPWRRGAGTLVLAEVEGRALLHRVVRIDGARVLLRAEACQREDWVDLERLCAEVYSVRRRRRRWLARLRRWLGTAQRSGDGDAGSPSKL